MLLVTGASGFLGGILAHEALASGRAVVGAVRLHSVTQSALEVIPVDLTTKSAANELISRTSPDWVVNCAAFTNVDECEVHPDRPQSLNVEVPRLLAAACDDAGIGLIHISTDSVFDGARGNYTEQDEPRPLNVYARSKLEGEQAVREACPHALVIRTNFVGLSQTRKAGLADWISSQLESAERIKGFTDVVFAPLLANNLARIVFDAMDAGLEGLYHACAADSVSKHEFAKRLALALGFDPELVEPVLLSEAELAAPRPLNTSLSSARLETALGQSMPTVDAAIYGYAALHAAACAGRS
jgi:dTDP-4-dehydrorhamnose reductase